MSGPCGFLRPLGSIYDHPDFFSQENKKVGILPDRNLRGRYYNGKQGTELAESLSLTMEASPAQTRPDCRM